MMSEYRDIIIKTYLNIGEASSKPIRAHPLPGQGYSPDMNIECSADMREQYPVGTLFQVKVKITDRDGSPFLYRHYQWDYEVVSSDEAVRFIKEHFKPDH